MVWSFLKEGAFSLLNEIGEYEQYTLSIEELLACKTRRLERYNLVKEELSGLERAMTIIARHFIFDTSVGFNEEELCEILKAWCGFEHKAKTPLPEHFEGWLKNYMRYVLLHETFQKCLKDKNCPIDLKATIENISSDKNLDDEKLLEKLKDIDSSYSEIKNLREALNKLLTKEPIFSEGYFNSLSSKNFRAITYDKVIANALLAGKLRCCYLACDEELFQTKKILRKGGKKIRKGDKDTILKMTAEYLLHCQQTEQKFIVTNGADMANWLLGEKKTDFVSKARKEKYLLAETNENLFEIKEIDKINVIKAKLNPEWAKHFRLIEVGSDDKWGQIFFSDSGSSDYLKENFLSKIGENTPASISGR